MLQPQDARVKFLEAVIAIIMEEFKMSLRRLVVKSCRKKRHLFYFKIFANSSNSAQHVNVESSSKVRRIKELITDQTRS